MQGQNDIQSKILEIARKLPPNRLEQVVDFMEFLCQKEKGFDYSSIEDSAEYVRQIRLEQSMGEQGKEKDPEQFLRDLIEWQELNS